MRTTERILLLLLVVGLWTLPAEALAGTSLTILKHVSSGSPATITLNSAEALPAGHLRVIYRPGSVVEVEERIPVPLLAANTPLSVKWTPQEPGLARVEYHSATGEPSTQATLRASALTGVRFATTPISGVLVMIFAGVVLFGGCCFSFRLLTSRQAGEDATAD